MSKENLIESLLSGFVEGRLTPDEKHQLYDLLAEESNMNIFRRILLDNFKSVSKPQAGKEPDFDSMYRKIINKIDRKDSEEEEIRSFRRKTIIRRILAYSSAAAAVFILAFFIGRQSGNNLQTNPVTSVTLTEVRTPLGSRSELKLPDGTDVILNAGSVVSYYNDYNSAHRNVTLTGEAYFKVAHNENIPFIVKAGSVSIKALGTEFNVKAYNDENIIEATLIKGKINIRREGTDDPGQAVELAPNQKAIYLSNNQGFLLEDISGSDSIMPEPEKTSISNLLIAPRVNTDQVVAWTEGKLIFNGECLDKFRVDLERKYNVTFIFLDDEVKKVSFKGVLRDETLEQVLNVISLSAPVLYSLEGKNVYLYSDQNSLNRYSKFLK